MVTGHWPYVFAFKLFSFLADFVSGGFESGALVGRIIGLRAKVRQSIDLAGPSNKFGYRQE